MAKDPAFLFYSSDFLSGVSDLTMEERGQYITLLCLQHQKGHLTEKAIKITVPNVSNDVLSKFTVDENGHYFNERLEVERDKRLQHSEKQRQRALDGWKKRKAMQSDGNATANATALPLENRNENENISDNAIEIIKGIPFEEFWNLYDKKVGDKRKVQKKWKKLKESDHEEILNYLPKYIQSQPDKKFRKNPETFLNNESWKDELIFETKQNGNEPFNQNTINIANWGGNDQ